MKTKTVQIRLSDVLLEKYEKALDNEGLSKTTHLTSAIHDFVEKNERKESVSLKLTDLFDGKIETAEKFLEMKQYPPIGRSLFWFGYLAKRAEKITNIKKENRFYKQIKDVKLFSIKDVMFINGLVLERLNTKGKMNKDMERILELAYRDFSEKGEPDMGVAFYWMAGYVQT